MIDPRHLAWTTGRLALAGFCWFTALYAFVTSSAFAYLQFIKPRVFPWVGQLSDLHAFASVVALAVIVAVVWSDLRGPDRVVRILASAGLLLSAAAVAWNLFRPLLPDLTDGARTVWVGVLALLPLVWLAALDLLASASYLHAQRTATLESEHQLFEGRLLGSVAVTAVAIAFLYAVLTATGLVNRFEPDLLLTGQVLGFGVSLVYHLALLVSLFLLLAAIARVTGKRFILQYGLISLVFVALVAFAFARIVGDALSLHGFPAALAATATALSIVGTWTGLRLRRLALQRTTVESALDLYFGASRQTRPEFARVAFVAMFAFAVMLVSRRMDWDFALLDSGVVIVWTVLLALAYQEMPAVAARSTGLVAISCAAPLGVSLGLVSLDSVRPTVDRYAVYNPSFRVAQSILGNNSQAISSFDRYLRANTGLTDVHVPPIDLDFVANLGAAAGPRPSLFLFVIDSLRPDYLAPYNAAVQFTPRIAGFAAESVVFTNAITRYGGTGLSVPAMWAGSAIVHKQYVTPFHPMNSLEKLLAVNRYKRLVGLDSIMGQLLELSPDIDELDRGRPVMDYEFCRTLGELESKLPVDGQAVFAYSLPQDIHMSKLPRTVESGEEYRSFYAPYATKVHAIDGCFGKFVDTLKAKGLYDDSLIVLTSDHGEMLGEDGRFGHSYHLFPQIVHVPLIVHLPASVKQRAALDPDAVALTTDIAPTMYAALGYDPVRSNHLMGRSLVGVDETQSLARRRESVVIAASYGAVYAVASHNGRRLYVADAVRGGDQAFEQHQSAQWTAVPVTPGLRALNQLAIRQYVDDLSRLYRIAEIKN